MCVCVWDAVERGRNSPLRRQSRAGVPVSNDDTIARKKPLFALNKMNKNKPTYMSLIRNILKDEPNKVVSRSHIKKKIHEYFPDISEGRIKSNVAAAIKKGIEKQVFTVPRFHTQSVILKHKKVSAS